MAEECWMCEESDQLIKKHNHWKVLIHPNQYYLGRTMVALNRHVEDLTEAIQIERSELFDILKGLRRIYIQVFGANLINYASLGNETRHLHLHVIPRYDHEVKFEGVTFRDENWGKNYVSYSKDFVIPYRILDGIMKQIGVNL